MRLLAASSSIAEQWRGKKRSRCDFKQDCWTKSELDAVHMQMMSVLRYLKHFLRSLTINCTALNRAETKWDKNADCLVREKVMGVAGKTGRVPISQLGLCLETGGRKWTFEYLNIFSNESMFSATGFFYVWSRCWLRSKLFCGMTFHTQMRSVMAIYPILKGFSAFNYPTNPLPINLSSLRLKMTMPKMGRDGTKALLSSQSPNDSFWWESRIRMFLLHLHKKLF